jgi:short-subunit dehydrogenase
MSSKFIAIITGASRGIGHSIATSLAHNPKVSHIVLVSRSESRLKKLEEQLLNINNTLAVKVIVADLSDNNEPNRIISETVSDFGQINLLINNAGVFTTGLISELRFDHKENELQKQFQVNVFSVIQLTTSAIPYLRATKRTVINISSGASQSVVYGASLYGTTKIALNHFTAHLAGEEPVIIAVAVDPGIVETEMLEFALSDKNISTQFTKEKVQHVLLQPSTVGKRIAEFALLVSNKYSGKYIDNVSANEEVGKYLQTILD